MTDRTKEGEIREKEEAGVRVDPAQWYAQAYRNRTRIHKPPSSIPTYKESHPYRLVLNRLIGLTLSKKSSGSDLFLSLEGLLFTQGFIVVGAPFHYQFQSGFGRDGRWEVPVALYFHSRIDKNYEGIYLLVKYRVIQIRQGVVENSTEVGSLVIKNPLVEETAKVLPVLRDINQVEFGCSSAQVKAKTLTGSSSVTAEYSVESLLELKRLVRLIPENVVFTHQDHITGVAGGYLPREVQDIHIQEARSVTLTVTYLQVHISDRFEQDLVAYFKKNYPAEKTTEIKGRRIVVGFHNEYQLVGAHSRRLELVDKEQAGQVRILIFEGLKEGQVIKVPFYWEGEESLGIVTVGLLYEVGGREVQVACSYFLPIQNGSELSEHMHMGAILGASQEMLAFPTNEAPTLILQYSCNLHDLSAPIKQEGFLSSNDLRSKVVSEQLLAEERERLKQQIELERAAVLKEKEEMERLRVEKDVHFQAEFEKKFETEKDNLYKRQQMIEAQYRQQVEREVREKFHLEEEVKRMVQRIKMLEEHAKKASAETSFQNSPLERSIPSHPDPQLPQQSAFPIRQRMDPGYIIEPENVVPVKKVRQIMEREGKGNVQVVRQSEEQFGSASRFTINFTAMVWQQHLEVPPSFYLVIRFFNQGEFRTESLGCLQKGEGGYHKLVKLQHYHRGLEDGEPSFCFTIDPSDYHQPALLQKDLTHYLYSNSAIIDVFSAETHLYIGQLNIKLRDLLRGSRAQTLIARQLKLVKIKNKEVLGVMQVLLKNEQVPCKEEISIKHELKVKDLRKKVVSNHPLQLNPNTSHNNYSKTQIEPISSKNLHSNRQELRIQKFKEQKSSSTFASSANNFARLDETQKGYVLGQIATYKERKIQDFLKGAYQELLNDKIIISAHYGRAVTFPFLFTNTSHTPSSYRIAILHPHPDQQNELTVVKNNKEWRYLTGKHNYTEPKRYDMVGENGTFFLQPGESLPLVFKFLSFEKEQATGGRISREKLINVTICKEENNWIAGGFSLLVNMHQQVIHHSYILYQPGEQIVDLIVPVIYSQTDNNSNAKKLFLTNEDPSASAVWLNNYEILIRIPTPKIMQKLKFNLLLYDDDYFCQLTENWLIEVHAYEGVCTTFRPDFNTRFKITLPWSAVPSHLGLLSLDKASNCLNLYASNSGLVFKDSIIELEADRKDQGSYQIWCELIGSENTLKNFEITCVSGDEGELIYGWVVTVYPYIARS